MKQRFIMEVEQSLLSVLDNAQMKALHEALTHALWGKDVVAAGSAEPQLEAQSNQQLLDLFLSAKRVEGWQRKDAALLPVGHRQAAAERRQARRAHHNG